MPTTVVLCFHFLTCMIASTFRGEALRLMKVSIPGYKLRGEMAILECDYELDGEVLYAVKWYKDNEEFYRFVPKSNPPQHSYKVDGIKVDHQLSDSKQVVLRGVNLKSSGLYRCEVSAEAPSFSSAQDEGRMDVVSRGGRDTTAFITRAVREDRKRGGNVPRKYANRPRYAAILHEDLPKDGPHITGEEKEYQIGNEILLNCTSGKSYPASALHWYINDKEISDPNDLVRYPIAVHSHGLLTTTLGLRLRVINGHFEEGQMRVKCVASVSPVLWQGNRESVVQRVAPLIDNREAHFLVKGAAAGEPARASATFLLFLVLFVRTFF